MTAFLDSNTSFNQGDLLCIDTSTHIIRTPASAADTQAILGVAPVTISNGKLLSSYQGTAVDAAQSGVATPGPEANVEALMTLKTGDTFNPGDLVYPSVGDDAQTITTSNPCSGSACGVFQDSAVASAASGQKGRAVIGHRFPGNTLVI
jgi:hypothetical protein